MCFGIKQAFTSCSQPCGIARTEKYLGMLCLHILGWSGCISPTPAQNIFAANCSKVDPTITG